MQWRSRLAELFGADLRSVAAFRIAVAFCVLGDVGLRALDLGAHYTDRGILPRSVALTLNPWMYEWAVSLHLTGGGLWSQTLFCLLTVAAALAMLFGYRSRLAAATVWFLISSVQLRNLYIGAGYDALLRLALFWACFLPLGARCSIDSIVRPQRHTSGQILSVGTVAILFQIAAMYVCSGYAKLGMPLWDDGSAIAMALNDDLVGSPRAVFLLGHPAVCQFLTRAIVAMELVGPLLLFVPFFTGPIRTFVVFAFWLMQLGFGVFLVVALFPWISAALMLVALPPWFWDRLVAPLRLDERVAVRPLAGRAWRWLVDRASRWEKRPRAEFPWVRWWRRHGETVLQSACAVCLAFVVFWIPHVTIDRGYVAPPVLSWFGRLLFLQQDWRMFSTPSSRTGFVVMPGRLLDGREVDLFKRGGPVPSLGDYAADEKVSWEAPRDVAGTFRGERWRAFLGDLIYGSQDAQLLESYGRYMCREWNARHEGDKQLDQFEIVWMATDVTLSRADRRYDPVSVWRHLCFG